MVSTIMAMLMSVCHFKGAQGQAAQGRPGQQVIRRTKWQSALQNRENGLIILEYDMMGPGSSVVSFVT